ncbi:co-chaperone GroES [Candidatus Falkowbacteria bacterium CG10_big_fil_rev_8_21_14_0_10_39_9]|uniref:Co-chaperonin GroES n=1 Tax=Candidatus Falkowbacteria bacterium CG10_big_fil_rev_8_21_14_0_10_39_9 TaxID=1974566 RepID=A0A2M6WQ79_9BACT|nr:MAG: co-chaperone GroES [Candidatus Falkowbacteria bacterium CG10_big_fil_rev_8_21_14_0_10_39_9]
MNLKPLNDNVLIKPQAREEATKSGIVLPSSTQNEGPQKGQVLAVGEGRLLENGSRAPLAVSVGDQVMYKKSYSAEELELDEGKCVLVGESDILGIIK